MYEYDAQTDTTLKPSKTYFLTFKQILLFHLPFLVAPMPTSLVETNFLSSSYEVLKKGPKQSKQPW